MADAAGAAEADARAVPSVSDQLRSTRHRRQRRRRLAVAALLAVPAALAATRLLAGASTEPAGATSIATTTTPSALGDPSLPRSPEPDGLHPGLLAAFAEAQAAAAEAGHELTITSGFRTAAEQAALLRDEVAERGSLEEALWWVFPPDRSMHVQGLAIDVGDEAAAAWLADAGARFGLCRTLAWEWWHFEWRERWEAGRACPAPARTREDAPQP